VAALGEIRQCGVPNYFDDQRFGSVSDGAFVGKALVLGDFEQALRLALAAPYDFDRKAEKQEKAVLQTHWGDWETCHRKLRPGHTRSLVDHLLRNPHDFRGAIARLRPELRGLYLAAYQSHLWNRILARWLRDHIATEQLVEVDLRLGRVPMHRLLDPTRQSELASLQIALPTARGEVEAGDRSMPLMQAVLQEEGLTREQLKVKGLREAFFSRGQRAALCVPTAMQWEDADDDLNEGRKKVMLGFELPRGNYATLIVKRAFSV
jgi:tRNA pseudouridine13 synthase